MIAKNVGIRRARSQFVLATNIDILFSDEIMRFLASGQIDPNRMYRIDRHDVPANVPKDVPIEQQLEFCRQNVIRVHGRRPGFQFKYSGSHDLRHSNGENVPEPFLDDRLVGTSEGYVRLGWPRNVQA